jgi:hypothetical protein
MITNRRPSRPPLDERVERLLNAASAPSEPGPVPGEDQALAAFRASQDVLGRTPMRTHLTSAKTAAAAALSVGLLVTGGAAAAGALPAPAQDAASEVLATVGIDVPMADERAGENPERRGPVEATEEESAVEESPVDVTYSEHGRLVSELAQTTDLTGRDKGAAISELASSKSKGEGADQRADGENRPEDSDRPEGAGAPDGAPAEERKPTEPGSSGEAPPVKAPPSETPNEGGNADVAPPVETPAPEGDAETGEESAQGSTQGGADSRP